MSNSSLDQLNNRRAEWRTVNDRYYEALWQTQRMNMTQSGRVSSLPIWFELNWQISNDYWIDFLTRRAPGQVFLECGAATGRLPLLLAQQGWQCSLIDITVEGPRLARDRFQRAGVAADFIRGDVFQLPFQDDTFDVVYSSGLLDVLPDVEAAIREMRRVLKPNGLLVAIANPHRLSIQTVSSYLLDWSRWVWRFLRRRPTTRPRDVNVDLHRNRLSFNQYLAACRAAGLRDVRGHGIGFLPVIALPERLMRLYLGLTRHIIPLCHWFDRSEARWTAVWGVLLAMYGFKPAS